MPRVGLASYLMRSHQARVKVMGHFENYPQVKRGYVSALQNVDVHLENLKFNQVNTHAHLLLHPLPTQHP